MLRKKLGMDDNDQPSNKKLRTNDEQSTDEEQSNNNCEISSHHFQTQQHFWHLLDAIECRMIKELEAIEFVKHIAFVYNPIAYARKVHINYMAKYLNGPKKVVFIGMNPGPNGMVQTGVLNV